ncbi:unnamed protein product [Ectocarpus sp. CCAP 1310/34]|nr:unnamed protein product [Ectocarpus sp. CCAP 1310/34]
MLGRAARTAFSTLASSTGVEWKGELKIEVIVDISVTEDGLGFDAEVIWVALDKEKNAWEELSKIWDAAPQFRESKLRRLGLPKEVTVGRIA